MIVMVGIYFQRGLSHLLVFIAGALLLQGLPATGMCQGPVAPVQEAPGPMEEVIVWGNKPLKDLERELYRAEEELYGLFNTFNADDGLEVHCYREATVGTRIKQRVCRTNLFRKLLRQASQRMTPSETALWS